jgi:NADH:ubiquinone oxidoreductase subunit 2 (subunit N)
MYMDAPGAELTIDPRAETRWVLSATAVATLFLGILPSPLMDLCVRAITASM